jgi:hypothetical protein
MLEEVHHNKWWVHHHNKIIKDIEVVRENMIQEEDYHHKEIMECKNLVHHNNKE